MCIMKNSSAKQPKDFHTDIEDNGLIALLPDALHPYALIMRLDRPIGIWLLFFPSLWGILLGFDADYNSPKHLIVIVMLFALGAIIMRGAGCIINDIWDRDIDRQVARTRLRPLASEALSLKQASIYLIVLLCFGLAILLCLNTTTLILGVLSLPLIITYPLMKRITWWPQAFLGLTFNFGAIMGYSAVTTDITMTSVILYISCVFWTLGYDTIYALQDKEDDALAGIRSTALKFGGNVKYWLCGFYISSAIWLLISVILSSTLFSFTNFTSAALCLTPAFVHLFRQIRLLDQSSPESALAIFKSNFVYGTLVTLGILATTLLI